MKIALDPYMLRRVPLTELPGVVADLGYEYIELSPRADFTPFFLHPRANSGRVRDFKAALDAAGVGFDGIATVCVFAWEERARESCAGNLEKVRQYLAKYS